MNTYISNYGQQGLIDVTLHVFHDAHNVTIELNLTMYLLPVFLMRNGMVS